METPQLLLLVLLGLRTNTNCLHLPPYIKPCSRNDPNFNACNKEHAIDAIPHFINGDPKYRVPTVDPLQIEQLSFTEGSSNFGLSLIATNLTVIGLKSVQVKDIRTDLKTQHVEYDLYFPNVEVYFQYNVSGRVLRLPITGSGDGVIAFKEGDVRIVFDYDLVRRTAQEKEYILPKNFTMKTEHRKITIHLDNLFNGNKLLGDNMNLFLNENWKELEQDLAPTIGTAIGLIMKRIFTNIAELIPFEEIFPETV